jgi:CheY-like chemotaxis protein
MDLASVSLPESTDGHLVLLVDRDDDTRRMYAEYLKIDAWRVDEAGDGREALAKAISTRPDIVVTETRLPGINGFDLCDLLRRDVTTSRIPIVVVTADAYRTELEHAKSAGADSVLTKPCLPEHLARELRRVLETSATLRERSDAVRGKLAGQLARAQEVVGRSQEVRRRYTLKRVHQRGDTINPPIVPPILLCPTCDRALVYQRSHLGGVSSKHPEQWDYYDCPGGCGTFQYRPRTRKVRKVA